MEIYNFLVYVLVYIGLFLLSFYVLSFIKSKKEGVIEADDKTVSIIIPAHNEEDCIVKTVQSALSLDYPREKLEIIVVDDGSSDKTYSLARNLVSPNVRVFTKSNGGKGSALNFGIKKARGEIIVSMDADTYADKCALKRLVARFYSKDVMSVTSAMGVYKPKTLWQRIQHIEYYLSLFIRTNLAGANAIYITPGAFSAYRKEFFDKHGGYDEHNITEDLEIALRIQSHNYVIEVAPGATFYTIAPATFKSLLAQRKRWYTGLIRNLWNYRKLFGFRRGVLGIIVLPASMITVFLSIVLTGYIAIHAIRTIGNELLSLRAVDFHFVNAYEMNSYFFTQVFYNLFSNPVFLFTLFFIVVMGFYLLYAKKQMMFRENLKINFIIFLVFYSILFSFWWIVSLFYIVFNRNVQWGGKHAKI